MNAEPEAPISAIEAYEHYVVRSLMLPWSRDLIARSEPVDAGHYLDLACGTGIVSRTLAAAAPGTGRLCGLDISPGMLAKAEALADDIEERGWVLEWHEGCACSLPFPDECFDRVFCQHGLQFFPDPLGALKEVRRVLKPGSLFAASVWGNLDANPFYAVIDRLVSTHLAPGALALPFSLSDKNRLRELARSAGFDDIHVEPVPMQIEADEPERFSAMCLRGATAVLPEFAALSANLRQDVLDRLYGDVDELVSPFRQGDRLRFGTLANVLVARC